MGVPFTPMKRTAAMQKAIAKSGASSMTLQQLARYYGGPTFGHISQEYLFTSNVYPLGTMVQLFGTEGCCKSTLAVALLNQLFLESGGEGHVIDTENKVSTQLIQSLIPADILADSSRFTLDRAMTQEKAQTLLTIYGNELNAVTFGKRKDPNPHLLGLVLDSFRVASETTQDQVTTDGHAKKNFATEANLWRSYLPAYAALLEFAPMSLIVVNHLVEKQSATGFGVVKDVGGGRALKFFETYQILVNKVNAVTKKSEVYTDLSLQTFKNSNGIAKRKIYPRVIYKSEHSPEGQTVVDWFTADMTLLAGPDIPRELLRREGICSVKESSVAGLYSDDVLGLTKVTPQKIIEVIYSDPDRLAQLRKALDINVYNTLEDLWDRGWFYDARGVVVMPEGSKAKEEDDAE